MAYSDLDDVKRLLRVLANQSNNQHKVKFSGSYKLPKNYSTNSGDGVLTGLTTIRTDYAGSEFWHIKFTSGTAFTLYRGEDDNTIDGTGDTSTDFTSTSGIISINTGVWSGTPVTDDQFSWYTDSNISEDDGDEFINDADAIINGILQEMISVTYVPFTSTIPDLIRRASMYLGANLIFMSVFSNLDTEDLPSLVRRWFSLGKDFVTKYLESIPAAAQLYYKRYGRFASREPLFEKIGVTEASGIEGFKGEINVVDEAYDTDYNDEETLGTT